MTMRNKKIDTGVYHIIKEVETLGETFELHFDLIWSKAQMLWILTDVAAGYNYFFETQEEALEKIKDKASNFTTD